MREIRPRALIKSLLECKKIEANPQKLFSVNECVLMSHEIIEAGGRKVFKRPGHNERFIHYKCDRCRFNIHFVGSGDGNLSLCDIVSCHDEDCDATHIIGTNYTYKMLASALASMVREKLFCGENISTVDIRNILDNIVCGPVKSISNTVLCQAKKLLLRWRRDSQGMKR